jgi:hypothetical protein
MHQESLLAGGIPLAHEQPIQTGSIDHVISRRIDFGQRKNRGPFGQ